jgi:hypothetical protein
VSLVGIVVVKFKDAIARVLERIKIRVERGATFRAGVAALIVASLPVVRSRAPTTLSRDSCDFGVVAASSIPQGVCSLHYGCSHPMGTSSYRFAWKAVGELEIWQERDHCQVKLLEGDAA